MLVDDIVADMLILGMSPQQVFGRLVSIFGQEEATRAIALHVMRLRIVAAIEEEQEDPIHAVIEQTLQGDEAPPTPANITLTPGKTPLNEKCVICMEDTIERPVTLVCGHSFCYGCIGQWFSEKNTCPTCRTCVDAEGIRPKKRPREEQTAPPRRRRVVRRRLTIRARPMCRHCGQPMRGHRRGVCQTQTASV
tara:strand:+ start:1654 stop:2232 length:579 start_codon:yes stop_codon:yes gene_type:complete